jgi:hypothetical protein
MKRPLISGLSLFLCAASFQQVLGQRVRESAVLPKEPCDAYEILGVQAPNTNSTLSRVCNKIFGTEHEQSLKRWVWKLHGKLLPVLHIWDGDYAPELFVNLRVLWNKALSSVDPKSPVYEGNQFRTYIMLPRSSRWILRVIPARWFPRWYHANIELRTAYLNQAIDREIDRISTLEQSDSVSTRTKKVLLVVLGAGYDVRSIRLLIDQHRIEQAWEFDLPPVMEAKARMVQRRKLLNRDPLGQNAIQFVGVDLNEPASFRSTLMEMGAKNNSDDGWYTIVVSEALFLYLQPDIPAKLLDICQEVFSSDAISLCFADRLKGIPNDQTRNREAGSDWFAKIGWTLIDWLPKDGATRHMGTARPRSSIME